MRKTNCRRIMQVINYFAIIIYICTWLTYRRHMTGYFREGCNDIMWQYTNAALHTDGLGGRKHAQSSQRLWESYYSV